MFLLFLQIFHGFPCSIVLNLFVIYHNSLWLGFAGIWAQAQSLSNSLRRASG